MSLFETFLDYLRDAAPGGALNPQVPEGARFLGGLLGSVPSKADMSNWDNAVKESIQTGQVPVLPEGVQRAMMENMFGAGIIAGPLARTANLKKLEEAKGLFGKVPEDEIYEKTGWWLGHPDGVPRFEIDDSVAEYRPGRAYQMVLDDPPEEISIYSDAARLRRILDKTEDNSLVTARKLFADKFGRDPHPDSSYIARWGGSPKEITDAGEKYSISKQNWSADLGSVLDHQQLYETYPSISGVGFNVKDMGDGSYGSYTGEININPDIAYGLNSGKSTTLHEIQHGIQKNENMAKGGQPEQFYKLDYRKELKLLDNLRKTYREYMRDGMDVSGIEEQIKDQKEVVEMARRKLHTSAYDMYKALAGETEARLVQDRMNMTMPERMTNPFYKGYDVPLDQQIVRRR